MVVAAVVMVSVVVVAVVTVVVTVMVAVVVEVLVAVVAVRSGGPRPRNIFAAAAAAAAETVVAAAAAVAVRSGQIQPPNQTEEEYPFIFKLSVKGDQMLEISVN